MSFGERLKKRREELKLTQEEVGAFINDELSRQAVSKWERDETYPEVEKVLLLSVKLDISLNELFTDELAYLNRNKESDSLIAIKYHGLITGMKTFAEMIKKMDL